GFFHCAERNKANLVGLPHFFQRPTNTRIARQSHATIGRSFKGGNGDSHDQLLLQATRAGAESLARSSSWAFQAIANPMKTAIPMICRATTSQYSSGR